jgi:hypothetical protein
MVVLAVAVEATVVEVVEAPLRAQAQQDKEVMVGVVTMTGVVAEEAVVVVLLVPPQQQVPEVRRVTVEVVLRLLFLVPPWFMGLVAAGQSGVGIAEQELAVLVPATVEILVQEPMELRTVAVVEEVLAGAVQVVVVVQALSSSATTLTEATEYQRRLLAVR